MDMAADRETMERRERNAAIDRKMNELEQRLRDAEARVISLERSVQHLMFARGAKMESTS